MPVERVHYDYVCLSSSCIHLNVDLPVLQQKIQRFSDGEIVVEVPSVQNASLLFLTSMAGNGVGANDHLIEALVTLRALRSAKHITLGILYGAYTRQADGGQLMYDVLRNNAHDMWILDPHVPPPLYVSVRTTTSLFAGDIATRFVDPVIVSPDQGGVGRASAVAHYLKADLCILSKNRGDSVSIEGMTGVSVGSRTCVIVDDIIHSGQTLLAAHTYLMGRGAKEVHVYATHGLMNQRVAKILSDVFASLRITDSVPHKGGLSDSSVLSLGHSQLLEPSLLTTT